MFVSLGSGCELSGNLCANFTLFTEVTKVLILCSDLIKLTIKKLMASDEPL